MDPLHPLVPIQPPAPIQPDYTRVQRIERDQQRESAPDWQQPSDDEAQDEGQFEDDYDPDWTDPAASEPYGPDGARQDATSVDPGRKSNRPWNPRRDGERRSKPRPAPDDSDDAAGPHIDISA